MCMDFEDSEEMWRSHRKYQRKIFRRFLNVLLFGVSKKTTNQANIEDFVEGKSYRFLCLLSMIFNRSWTGKDNDKAYDYITVAYINYDRGGGYYWSCDLIEYNPKNFRFKIEREGESLM